MSEKMPNLEEMAKIQKERTLSDAELLKNGAEYEFNKNVEQKLEVTEEQKKTAKAEMDKDLNLRYLKSEEGKIETEKLIEKVKEKLESLGFDSENDTICIFEPWGDDDNIKHGDFYVFRGFEVNQDGNGYLLVTSDRGNREDKRGWKKFNVRDVQNGRIKIENIEKGGVHVKRCPPF